MFKLKVVSAGKRRASDQHQELLPRLQATEIPPILQRWSDFTDPFPPVSPGGYTKYYMVYGDVLDASSIAGPSLSNFPEPSPSCEIPEKSLLFSLPTPPVAPPSPPTPVLRHALSIIPESLLEGTSTRRIRPPNPSSLRRRRRRVLRTPSIERDFAVTARHLFASHLPAEFSMSTPEFTTSHTSHFSEFGSDPSILSHISQSSEFDSHQCATSHDTPHSSEFDFNDSNISHSSHSSVDTDSNQSHFVDTPFTSLSDVGEDLLEHPEKAVVETADLRERPGSRSSFCTAKSDFSDV